MNNLQDIKNEWYLEQIRRRGLRLGDEISIHPFNERAKNMRLTRKDYKFCYKIPSDRPWDIQLPRVMEKEFNLQLKLIADGDREEGRYLLLSHCQTPFKVNGNFCYQSFIERGDEVEFGLHRITTKNHLQVTDSLEIPQGVVDSNLPILVQGETGTGKTHLVKKIHQLGRQVGRLVHLNLSSFSPNLFESELFGHVKGSFTGANRDRSGAIIEAREGTLFIDEVDSLPCELQVKLLLFLDDGKVRPVGGNHFKKVETRLIFASGRDLWKLVGAGKIRKDFFFRIQSCYKIDLPCLRDNRGHIESICQQFAKDENVSLSPQLIEFYQKCPWPGNIRQLLGHLKTKKVLSPSRKWEMNSFDYSLQDLAETQTKDRAGHFLDLKAVKKNYVQQVFESSNRDLRLVSQILKINPVTLRKYVGDRP